MPKIISSEGFVNTGYLYKEGVVGVKPPALPMKLTLDIKTKPNPYIILWINPNRFEMNFSKKVTPQRVRNGYVIQHAFDELEQMSCNCFTASMYTNMGLTGFPNTSAAYDQFEKMIAFFRNNGANFDTKYTKVINTVGRVKILYDGVEYTGCFDELGYTFSDESPFTIEYNWRYTVASTLDTNLYA